ncbi:hypothetical protein BpHYR1_023670 [Brachionus plicatilis]|uniref:Uncharacterized protein n=1 Tax=Brachionus plicatilis TaxID=10195 RepID=A0A3M7Q8Z6_BRAPC|nr:hypothetical protein BpHYR1_023670 [Brachionus plicatilis]
MIKNNKFGHIIWQNQTKIFEYKNKFIDTIKYKNFFIKSYKSEVNELSNIQDNIKKINIKIFTKYELTKRLEN